MSPSLFNLYSEKVINEALKDEDGIQVNGKYILNIRFADNTVLLASSAKQLQDMTQKVNATCLRYGVLLNKKKTKIMVTGKKKPERLKNCGRWILLRTV